MADIFSPQTFPTQLSRAFQHLSPQMQRFSVFSPQSSSSYDTCALARRQRYALCWTWDWNFWWSARVGHGLLGIPNMCSGSWRSTPSDSSSLYRTVPMCAKTFFLREKTKSGPHAAIPSDQPDLLWLVLPPTRCSRLGCGGYSLVAFTMTQQRRVNVSPRSGRTNTNTHLVLNASERWSRLCVCGPRRLRCLFSSGWCPLSRRRHSRPVVLSHTDRC